MGIFFAYILKSAVCLSAFYLFYRWLLSRETFHRFNRIALLGLLSISLVIPLIEVTVKEHTEVNKAVLTIEQLLIMAQMSSDMPANAAVTTAVQPAEITFSWIQIGLLVYLAGILFFTCRNLYSLFRMLLLLRSGKKEKMDKNIVLIVHEKDISPFSWMKYIVISRKDMEENGREIVIHERAHILNRHSIDLLIADICVFFQWFNPGAWLLKQELQNIHEYEADETVIKEGVDAKQYQLLLIKKAVGTRLYSMANSFNHSKLKKRITMMLKEKSNPWARLKYLYVLPLAAIAVTAFARPEISSTVEEISALKVNELAAIVETKVAKSIPQILLADTALKKKVTVKVASQVETSARDSSFTIRKGEMSATVELPRGSGKPLLIINGKESDYDVWEAIQPSKVKVITAIPPGKATKYGAKGKNGVFEVILYSALKENDRPSDEKSTVIGRVSNVSGEKSAMIVIDGKESTREEFSALKLDNIKSYELLRGKAATDINGEKGQRGVVVITTKAGGEFQNKKADSQNTATFLLRGIGTLSKNTSEIPLILVDGVEKSAQSISEMNLEQIESFSVLKEKSAVTIYGDKGKNGVVLITTKAKQGEQKEAKKSQYVNPKNVPEIVKQYSEQFKFGTRKLIYSLDGERVSKEEMDKYPIGDIFAYSFRFDGDYVRAEFTSRFWDSNKKPMTSGLVKDSNGNPIVGAHIDVKGSANGTVTDVVGEFSIITSPKVKLIVSAAGMKPKEIKESGSRGKVEIILEKAP